MSTRKAVSPVVATVLLASVAITMAILVGAFTEETAYPHVQGYIIEHQYSYCVQETSVEYAKWRIVFNIVNNGTLSVQLNSIFLNEAPVNMYDMVSGDSLINCSNVGSNFPAEGLYLKPGEEFEIVVWVGESLYESGVTVLVRTSGRNNVSQNIIIELA
jgi:hypothetical protein